MGIAYAWPVGKLDLINNALVDTGNNLVAVANDGSDEWAVCSPAYDEALSVMVEEHGWGFATKVNANLTPSATAPANTAWDTAYPLPADLVHLIWVRLNQDTTDPVSSTLGQPCLYDIEGNMLVLNAQGGPPPPATSQTPAIVSIKYISSDMADSVNGTPLFVAALKRYVKAGIYSGLHEDTAAAMRELQMAEQLSQRARSRYDMQKPKRAPWNSRINAARRVRHPYPAFGINWWGGTGSSG